MPSMGGKGMDCAQDAVGLLCSHALILVRASVVSRIIPPFPPTPSCMRTLDRSCRGWKARRPRLCADGIVVSYSKAAACRISPV